MASRPGTSDMIHSTIILLLALAITITAESQGPREEIYAGALGGGLLGLVGYGFAWLILAYHRQVPEKQNAKWDIWSLWGLGLLIRVLLLACICAVFWRLMGPQHAAALNSLAAVYLVLHFDETFWLYRRLLAVQSGNGLTHGRA